MGDESKVAVEAPKSGAPSGSSPAPQPGSAGAPPAVSPAGASAGSGQPNGAPRTYTEEEVSNIVRGRLADEQKKYAPYKELGDAAEIRARLEEHKRLKEAFQPAKPQPTQEEVELRELLTSQFPGIDKVGDIEKRVQAWETASNRARAQTGSQTIARLAKEKLDVSDAGALRIIEGAISASIMSDQASLKAWAEGDGSVVEKHFAAVMGGGLETLIKSASAKYTQGKARDMAEVPPASPSGGVSAPVSNERKLTGEERREAAWNRMRERGWSKGE